MGQKDSTKTPTCPDSGTAAPFPPLNSQLLLPVLSVLFSPVGLWIQGVQSVQATAIACIAFGSVWPLLYHLESGGHDF